jgi:hypothetical protein
MLKAKKQGQIDWQPEYYFSTLFPFILQPRYSPFICAKKLNFTHAIYNLAAYPEYVEPLREEIQSVMSEEGIWTKKRVIKMRKLDSFIKESMRMHPFVQCTSVVKVVLT